MGSSGKGASDVPRVPVLRDEEKWCPQAACVSLGSGIAKHALGEPTGARAEEHDITEGCEQFVHLGQLAPEFRQR